MNDIDKPDLVKMIKSILGVPEPDSPCKCRPNSPDVCEYCTDMESGEKFVDQDKHE